MWAHFTSINCQKKPIFYWQSLVWSLCSIKRSLHFIKFNQREGMEAEQKRKEKKRLFGTQPKKKSSPDRMTKSPRDGTGDSIGWFFRYQWSTLIIYDSNLSMCGTFLKKLLPLPDIYELLSIQKETYHLNLSAVTWEYGHFDPQHRFLYQRIVQSWFASIPSSEAYISESHQKSDVFNQKSLTWCAEVYGLAPLPNTTTPSKEPYILSKVCQKSPVFCSKRPLSYHTSPTFM